MPALREGPKVVDQPSSLEYTTPQKAVRPQPIKQVRFVPMPANCYDALPVKEVSEHTPQLSQHTKVVGPSKAERKAI